MKEIWKDVPNYEECYQVSDLGRVKSYGKTRWNGWANHYVEGKIFKQTLNSTGYNIVGFTKCGVSKTYQTHQLVAMAFLGHTPCGYDVVVDHIDNDKLNNVRLCIKYLDPHLGDPDTTPN